MPDSAQFERSRAFVRCRRQGRFAGRFRARLTLQRGHGNSPVRKKELV